MPYNTSLAFDSVAIIESLRPGDFRSGRELYEKTIAPVSVADGGFLSELYEITTARELLGALRTIHHGAKLFHRSPIIHMAAHGNKEGLELASRDFVPWSEIAPALTAVNEASRMNLLVVAAMCSGWHMSDVF